MAAVSAYRAERSTALERRGRAVRALHRSGLSSLDISRLLVVDVKVFDSGRVTVRIRRASRFPLEPQAAHVVAMEGEGAHDVERWVCGDRALATLNDRRAPLFPSPARGRSSGLNSRQIRRILRAPDEGEE